jgi:alpha-beta hydrolase superfamily lysophospholipase
MPSPYFSCAAAALMALSPLAKVTAGAQQQAPERATSHLTIFVRNVPIGNEQVTVSRTADGWTISSSGRIGPPLDAVARVVEARYTADWVAREFRFDGTVRGATQSIRTVVGGGNATTDLDVGGQKTQKTDPLDPGAVLLLPNSFFGPYEAVAAKLRNAAAGTEIPVFGPPSITFTIRVGESTPQRIQTTERMITAKRTAIKFLLAGAVIDGDIWTDEASRLIRLSLPAQSLEVVREDVASVASRSVTISRPNDETVKVPANGFVLAGTLSRPSEPAAAGARLPAVVLVGGSGPTDRDGVAFGIPLLGQIADALANAGFIVVRYDKRGIGQSGGRAEAATLADYAEDVRAAVKLLSERRDVDPKRICVAGHSEGGAVALLAASKDKRIAAVVLMAASGVPGADLVLAQQRHLLDRMKLSDEERQAKIDLQKQLHQAVLTGKGWDQIPPDLRRTVDNPEFQSLLSNDPAKVMPDVRQPLLIVQGDLDTQVEPSNADKLEALARKRKSSPPVAVVKVPGVNHLLVPAKSGESDEYSELPDKHVAPGVTQALVEWLKKTL